MRMTESSGSSGKRKAGAPAIKIKPTPKNSVKSSAERSKKTTVNAAMRQEGATPKTKNNPLGLSASQRNAVNAYLRGLGPGATNNPYFVSGTKGSGKTSGRSGTSVNANAVGLGRNQPFARMSLVNDPKRALDRNEWGKAAENLTGVSDKNSPWMNAALLASMVVPVPGLRNLGAVGRAGAKAAAVAGKASKVAKPAANASGKAAKGAKAAPKTSRLEARDQELREIKRLMQPEPRPARPTTKFSLDDNISRAMRGKSGKVMSTGPKPVRGDFSSARSFNAAMKKWEKQLEANRLAARGGGDSLPAAASKPVSAPKRPSAKAKAKTDTPKVKSEAPASSKPAVEAPKAKGVTKPKGKASAGKGTKPGNALALRRSSTIATRAERASAPRTASKDLATEGVANVTWARGGANAGSRRPQLAIEGPKGAAKPVASKKPLALEGPKGATKRKFPKKTAIVAGVPLAMAALGEGLRRGAGNTTSTAKSNAGAEAPKRQVLRDKYGRQIGRSEYNRREKFRASLIGKSKAEIAKLRKIEGKRREEWRNTEGKKLFGSLAEKKTRNLDVPAWVSVRKKKSGRRTYQTIQERERFK